MPAADTLTDQQAEAALLALGSIFRWSSINDGYECASGKDGYYSVEPSQATKGVYKTAFQHDVDLGACSYKTGFTNRQAAKLACERHHATGKWD